VEKGRGIASVFFILPENDAFHMKLISLHHSNSFHYTYHHLEFCKRKMRKNKRLMEFAFYDDC